jgi:hypothetical protein
MKIGLISFYYTGLVCYENLPVSFTKKKRNNPAYNDNYVVCEFCALD